MDSLRGQLLVASPHLTDPNFFRSVVLLLQHDSSGALGVILNRPTAERLQKVLEEVGESDCRTELRLHLGGPVSGPLIALHADDSCAEMEILAGVMFATQKDRLLSLVRRQAAPLRVFSGYSGWSGGQLEGELEVGSWLTVPATGELVFSEADDLWRRVSNEFGRGLLAETLGLRHVPVDPSLN